MKERKWDSYMSAGAIPATYQLASLLRKNQTPAEQKLWLVLRSKPGGHKFRRQHPFAFYVLDFYSHEAKLAIELDGKIHQVAEVEMNDEEREISIKKMGVDVIRFTNEEVLNDVHGVLRRILIYIERK